MQIQSSQWPDLAKSIKLMGPKYWDFPKKITSKFPVLKDLSYELEGTFHVIAYAGKANDKRFIKRRQEYFKKKYPMLVPNSVYEDLRVPLTHVEMAYSTLLHLLDSNPSPKRITEECEDALFSNLLPPEPDEECSLE